MNGIHNLTRDEAKRRTELLEVRGYKVDFDFSGESDQTFGSRTEIDFACREPGAETFVEIAAEIRSATLNGTPLDLSNYSPDAGLRVPGLAANNTLVVEADCRYSRTGQGVHRAVDPVDNEIYLYSQFETTDAQRAFACFDQPDLKATFLFSAIVPTHWRAISNMPVTQESPVESGQRVEFAPTPVMSGYIGAICAGPYHEVRGQHDGIDLGLFCRASLAENLDRDAAEIFEITAQGFDHFHGAFGIRYPLPKYDQIFVPEYNMGAMENFGCVTLAEEHYLFRSQVTDFEHEQRANVILHEMAHMWFGDLVTMRWWDDLWLNESFAEWASHWANARATRFKDAWTTFLAVRKAWAYRQDQMPSTHPVYFEVPDVETVEANFDGITYAKGASVIKQLVAYVGEDAFVAGLREYFAAHQWSNATFDDLLTALERSSGRELRKFAAEWLETSQVNTLRPVVAVRDGKYESVVIAQEAPTDYPTLRTHRLALGVYDLRDGRLVQRERLELDVSGATTDAPALAGAPVADLLLVNDDDLTYAKIRLDERSMATVVSSIDTLESPLSRALCWSAAWDMVRDGELRTRDYVNLVLSGLPAERDINLVTATLAQARSALTFYAADDWRAEGWRRYAEGTWTAASLASTTEPAGSLQLAWTRAYASAAATAGSSADLSRLRSWLDGSDIPTGLTVDTGMRWHLLQCLVAAGAANGADIDAEFARDQTASGEREATLARTLIPTIADKATAWQRLITEDDLANWIQKALASGFQHPAQTALTAPYVEKYFDQVGEIWARRDNDMAQIFATLLYPSMQVSQATVDASDAWLAGPGADAPAPARRMVAEGKDSVVRALHARIADAA